MTSTITDTIFEALALADMERIHTQMLCWIFNQDKSIISSADKSSIINKIFNLNGHYENFEAHTEVKSIDLLIEATINSKGIIFVVENKLKSSERPGQTSDYKEIVKKDFPDKDIHYCFLTLSSENAQDSDWDNSSYGDLAEVLKTLCIDQEKDLSKFVFFNEYLTTIGNLVTTYKAFSNNHTKFENVFTDGSKNKYTKYKYLRDGQYANQPLCAYILKNQLETLFQRCFYKSLFSESILKKYIESEFQDNIEFSETRGNALVQIKLKNNGRYKRDNTQYELGWQLQGNTMKINFFDSTNYNKSKKATIEDVIDDAFLPIFHKKDNYKRRNRPRSKAYISVSKKLSKNLWEYSLITLAHEIKDELIYLVNISDDFKERASRSNMAILNI